MTTFEITQSENACEKNHKIVMDTQLDENIAKLLFKF